MKNFILIIVLLVIFAAVVLITNTGAPEEVEDAVITDVENTEENTEGIVEDASAENKLVDYDPSTLNFQFTGYGPGREHTGTFNKISIKDVESQGDLITSGSITFFMDSLDISPDALKSHLCTDAFFDCVNNPTAEFRFTDSVQNNDTEFTITGNLTVRGVTKQTSFTVTKDGDNASADFVIDLRQFGVNFPAIEDEARIEFNTKI
jgi:polyisoprenoid-binding protein YceI